MLGVFLGQIITILKQINEESVYLIIHHFNLACVYVRSVAGVVFKLTCVCVYSGSCRCVLLVLGSISRSATVGYLRNARPVDPRVARASKWSVLRQWNSLLRFIGC